MDKSRAWCLAAVFLGAAISVGPVAAAETFIMATGSTGGTSYFVGSAIAQVVNKHSDEVQIEVLPAGGTTETSGLILRGKAHFGLLTPSAASDAYNGKGPFDGHPVTNMRALWGGYYNYHSFIAPRDRSIASIEDLKGKRVGLCPTGTTCSRIAIATLEAAGLSVDDVDGQYLSFSEQVAALADNKLDAAVMFGGVPGAALLNATSQMDIAFLPLTDEVQTTINAGNEHFLKVELPAGTYRGQDDAVTSIGTEVLFVGASEVSREVIEEISEVLYANSGELVATMPLMQFFTPDNPLTLQEPAIPRHEGFEAYLKDSGKL
ncbi:TAXI family TRAP transporter solute-binding subunit [Marinovum sp.]|uniref:TAXI family TRAP transporter solute-binding subunit n=1 Tax=Marinovum sp. TaxID=2024839 RepID=UPI002B278FA1|nr:TAXI family TRAP transporter solute-binding subunit [Marinovum sp.]